MLTPNDTPLKASLQEHVNPTSTRNSKGNAENEESRMNENVEQVVLEIDETQVIRGVGKANAALDAYGKKATQSIGAAGQAFEGHGGLVVRTSDRTRNSVERLVASAEKLNRTYGQSGVEKLIAQRDQLIQRLGNEEAAVNRARVAYDGMIAAERSASGGSVSGAKAAAASIKGLEGGFLNSNRAAAAFLTNIAGMGPVLQAAFPIFGALALVGVIDTMVSKVLVFVKEIRDAPLKIVAAFRELRGSIQSSNDELGLTNIHLENAIAKLEHKPQNLVKEALLEARVEADKFGQSLEHDFDQLKKILDENTIGGFRQLLGEGPTEGVHNLFFGKSGFGGFSNQVRDLNAQFRANPDDGGLKGQQIAQLSAMKNEMDRLAEKDAATQRLFEAELAHPSGRIVTNVGGRLEVERGASQMLQEEMDRRTRRDTNAADESKLKSLEVQHAAGVVTEVLRGDLARAQEGELTGLAKINAAYREKLQHLIAEGHYNKTNFGLVTRTSDQEYANLLSKESEKSFVEQVKLRNTERFGGATSGMEEQAMMAAAGMEIRQQLPMFAGGTYRYDAGHKSQDQSAAEIVAERKVFMDVQKSEDDRHVASIEREATLQERLLKLDTDPGGERKLIDDSYRLRVDLAQQIYEIERRDIGDTLAGYKLIAQQDEVRIQRTLQIAELQHKQVDEIKNVASGLWNTLFTKPTEFGKQLASTLKAALLKPITEGLGEITANILHPTIFGKDGAGGISGMLHGIFHQGNRGIDQIQLVSAGGTLAMPVVIMGAAGAGGSSGGGTSADLYNLPTRSTFSRLAKIGLSLPLAAAMAMGAPGGSSAGDAGYATSQRMIFGNGSSQDLGGGAFGSPAASSPIAIAQMAGGGWSGAGTGGSQGGILSQILGGGYAKGGQTTSNPFSGMLKNLKGTNWGGLTRADSREFNQDTGGWTQMEGGGKITGVNGVAGAALSTGGMMLAQRGLMGADRGTWGGVAEGTLGGAAVGFQMGGPIGAAIGGGVGLLIGVGEKIAGVETPEREASRLIKQIYGINMDSTSTTIQQIVAMAKQSFGGTISIAVRSSQVRDLIKLFADSTGQRSTMLTAMQVHSASLTQSGGSLYQSATYSNGTPYSYASPLPTLGPSGATIPSSNPLTSGMSSIYLNPQQTVDLITTGATAAMHSNPRGVASAANGGNSQSAGRLNAAGMALDPGAIWS
jgi:hypothetical protein